MLQLKVGKGGVGLVKREVTIVVQNEKGVCLPPTAFNKTARVITTSIIALSHNNRQSS